MLCLGQSSWFREVTGPLAADVVALGEVGDGYASFGIARDGLILMLFDSMVTSIGFGVDAVRRLLEGDYPPYSGG